MIEPNVDPDQRSVEQENQALEKYRDLLITGRQLAQADYDKTVLTLSSGGLGISFSFVSNVVGPGPIIFPCLLALSWIFWGVSLITLLISHFTGVRALEKAVHQVDYERESLIEESRAGGKFSMATDWLNYASGGLFIIGVATMAVFVFANLGQTK